MWDFSIGRSLWVMARTLPYLLLRVFVYFSITFAYIVATGAGAGIGYTLGLAGSDDFQTQSTFIGGFIGFCMVGGIVYFLREYILYMVKAGHIAVMVELMSGEQIPGGQGQLRYGADIVKARFAEASILFGLDQLIKGVVRAITGLLGTISAILPIPGLQGLVGFISTVIRISVTYVDEVILARNMLLRSENPYATSKESLILYAQNGWVMVRNAVWLAVISWVVTIIVFFLMIAPAGAILYAFPGEWGGYGFIAAIIFAWAFRSALIEPFSIMCLMQVYFATIEGQRPDPEWDRRLTEVSDKFRSLGDKARDMFGGRRPAQAR
ncbi:MAG: hypothetical protein LCH46_02485 [Proteobacteria bacterium]|nr:hypothetical protein [Pseudomonadota bacterium]